MAGRRPILFKNGKGSKTIYIRGRGYAAFAHYRCVGGGESNLELMAVQELQL